MFKYQILKVFIFFLFKANDKTTVKILVVYDCIENVEELIKVDVFKTSFSMTDFEKYLDRKFCCNYELILNSCLI